MDAIEWQKPWEAVADGTPLVAELNRELSPGHLLFGRLVSAVGRRGDNDDVLFELLDEPPGLAVVHLTWRMSREPDPEWPYTVLYADMSNWRNRCMIPDHQEWIGGEGGDARVKL